MVIKKELGNVYTPDWIVDLILDEINYKDEHILNKKILEPSCGDGAFLVKIAERFIIEAKKKKLNNFEIKTLLENNIYGIELVKKELEKSKKRLDELCNNYGISDVNWQLITANTLELSKRTEQFKGFFDIVVGNPPYISIHNMDDKTKTLLKNEYYTCKEGMIDIYYAFFEQGLNFLSDNGVLAYITPNTFLHNKSAKNLRELVSKYLSKVINFNSFLVFDNASTYTAISILNKNKSQEFINYHSFNGKKIKHINELKSDDFLGNTKDNDSELKIVDDYYNVQYAITTLADKVFISKDIEILNDDICIFNKSKVERSIVKSIIKASTLEEHFAIYPYKEVDNKVTAYTEEELKKNFPLAYNYLLKNKKDLTDRSIEKNKNWYEYGRSQGLQNMNKNKVAISHIVKDKICYKKINKDTLVYSGLFATLKSSECNFKELENILNSSKFLKHIKSTGKDLRGGYKTMNSKHIKEFYIKNKTPS